MADTFFVSWALWQEMTFVLAGGIVLVFLVGLIKLWRGNRIMAKMEIVDEEKRARVSELRKTGLPAKRRTEIPFGVRALQNGVEVEGIFISRPSSSGTGSSDPKKDMSTTTTIVALGDPNSKKQPDSESTRSKPAPRRTPSSLSIMERAPGMDSAETRSDQSSSVARQSEDVPPPRSDRRRPSALNEEALRQLEGQLPQGSSRMNAYIPPSGLSSPESSTGPKPYRQAERRPGSSDSNSSGMSSLSIGQRQLPSRQMDRAARYASVPQVATEHCDCCNCQSRPNPSRTVSSQDRQFARPATTDMGLASPQPTFGPGESYINRASRRVNEGFEVLPAGRLGHPRSGRHHSNGM